MGVVIFHAFPKILKGGFVGVDIFFVISGYLITSIINASIKDKNFSIIEFYSRRINRIFPALILVLTVVLTFSWITLLPSDLQFLGKHVAGGMGFIQNILLYKEAGYFDSSAIYKPLLHLWSLGVEEQFYLSLPILALAFSLRHKYFPAALVIIALASFGLSLYSSYGNPDAAFYLPFSRAWELLIGGLIALFYVRSKFSPTLNNSLSIAGAILICASMIFIEKKMLFPGWVALAPTLGAAMIIMAGPSAFVNRLVLGSKPFVFIGLISFPLYLWHWPMLSIAELINSPSRLQRLGLMILAIILSIATYRLIEIPAKKCMQKGKLSLALLFAGFVLTIAGLVIYKNDGFPDRSSIKRYSEIDKSLSWSYSTNDLCTETFGKPDYMDSWMFCYTNTKHPEIIIIGNSFANHLYPGLVNNMTMKGRGVLSIGVCEPSAYTDFGRPENPLSPCASRKSELEKEFINKLIKKTTSINFVILNAWWPNFDKNGNFAARKDQEKQKLLKINIFDQENRNNNSSFDNYFYGLSERISIFEKIGKTVIIFGPKPELGVNIRECIDRPLKRAAKGCTSIKKDQIAEQEKFRQGIIGLQKSHPNLKYFDQFELFCNEYECSYFRDGMPLLRDDAHLSVYGSSYVMDNFVEWAKYNVPNFSN